MSEELTMEHAAAECSEDAVAAGTFGIALALSGAISAGAYTAGVIDFLVQALDAWTADEEPGTPKHNACITVISGASAGAVTGALGVVAMARRAPPVYFASTESKMHQQPGQSYQDINYVLPQLYAAWVTGPRMVAPDKQLSFLSLNDLEAVPRNRPSVTSLLNARLLDQIKDNGLGAPPGMRVAIGTVPYVARCLHVYLTISNLRGIPFEIKFGANKYAMRTHGDRMHYIVEYLGFSPYAASEWAEKDKVEAVLDARTLPMLAGQPVPPDWDAYGVAALASAAFPVGLAPREITNLYSRYLDRQYPMDVPLDCGINPSFPNSNGEFCFLNLDGGIINNNPFDYALYGLAGRPAPGKNAPANAGFEIRDEVRRGGLEATRAVIMVSPFPDAPPFPPEGQPAPELLKVLQALFPALINQSRFRASELAPALNQQDYSRFLIAPHRKLPGAESEERYAIACGLLGGFGGFLHEAFRAHDFQLGRRNCQLFLQRTFGLPVGNPIIAKTDVFWTIPPDPQQLRREARFPIIPLVGEARAEVKLPNWPRMTATDLAELMRQIERRLNAVGPMFLRGQTNRGLLRLMALGSLWVGRGSLLAFVRGTVLAELVRHDQLDGWTPPQELVDRATKVGQEPHDLSAIFAELASTTFDRRSADGIAKAVHLPAPFVSDVLRWLTESRFRQCPYAACKVANRANPPFYILASRAGGVRNWLVIGRALSLFHRRTSDLDKR